MSALSLRPSSEEIFRPPHVTSGFRLSSCGPDATPSSPLRGMPGICGRGSQWAQRCPHFDCGSLQRPPRLRPVQKHALLKGLNRSELRVQMGHGSPPSSAAMMSRAQPSGDEALPWLSRIKEGRIVLSGTPCCRARLQTIAESLAAESECDPALALFRNISANSPPFGAIPSACRRLNL
jgi:hypothetical protein